MQSAQKRLRPRKGSGIVPRTGSLGPRRGPWFQARGTEATMAGTASRMVATKRSRRKG